MTYPIVDIIKEVVAKVNDKLLPQLQTFDQNIQVIHFEHGHPKEIIETLVQMDQSPEDRYKKYPLVMLFQDFGEDFSDKPGSYLVNATLQIVIAFHTDKDLKAAERYSNTFKPVLYPIYDELKNQINAHKLIVSQSAKQIKHRKFDRLYWGREGLYGTSAGILNDYIDAIEVQNLQLTFNFKNLIRSITQISGQ